MFETFGLLGARNRALCKRGQMGHINLTGDYVWKGGDRDGQTQLPTAMGPQNDALAYNFSQSEA